MKSICFFSSYYTSPEIPKYVKFYLAELKRHFSEVIFLTNEKTLSTEDLRFLESEKLPFKLYKNEGFDFGMWFKTFKEYDVKAYDRVGLVNDSCILFNKLDYFFEWLDKEEIDYCGLTDCDIIEYHIQSYFIIINKKAIPHVLKYFETNGIISDMTKLIRTYEIGLTTYLKNTGMNVGAYYAFHNIPGIGNPSWMKAKNLMRAGYPLVKKKIMIRYYGLADPRGLIAHGFDPYPSHYVQLIKELVPGVNLDELLSGMPMRKTFLEEIQFHAMAFICRTYYKYKKIKHVIYVMIYGSREKYYMTVGSDDHFEEIKNE